MIQGCLNRNHVVMSLIAAFFFAGCSTSQPNTDNAEKLVVLPIARLVSPLDTPISRRDYVRYIKIREPDESDYDDRFRRAGLGRNLEIVDCDNVDWIGVVFWVDFSALGRSSSTNVLRFKWSHSDRNLEGSKYDYFENDRYYYRESPNRLYSERLQLEHEHELTNGEYSVTVLYMGAPIYSDSFNLAGCGNAD